MARTLMVSIAALLSLGGCAAERDRPTSPNLVTWQDDLIGIVPARCGGCHGGATPAAGYDATTYENVIAGGHAVAGDANSPVLTALDDATHANVADLKDLLRSWVVDSDLAYFDTPLHPPSWLDPSADDFHGKYIVDSGYNFQTCRQCHGTNFDGGTSKKACTTCHTAPGGPVACTTCHGQPPPTGAHQRHIANGLTCSACHPVPTSWDTPGHLPDVTIAFGALANADMTPSRRTGPPTYDASTKTCTNVYCHGGALGAGAGTHSSPKWTDGDDDVACGGCHGAPPADHPAGETECVVCHGNAPHRDGKVELGDNSGTCHACHGNENNNAPPRGLHGEVATTQRAVGAHQGHVTAAAGITAPIACDECHVTPIAVDSPGHLDGDMIAEVFPNGGGPIASALGATPTYDHTTGTCANTHCHGPATPLWTDVLSSANACGTCHGIPPSTYHDPNLTFHDCTNCHPDIDANGTFVVPSEHINGQVDLR